MIISRVVFSSSSWTRWLDIIALAESTTESSEPCDQGALLFTAYTDIMPFLFISFAYGKGICYLYCHIFFIFFFLSSDMCLVFCSGLLLVLRACIIWVVEGTVWSSLDGALPVLRHLPFVGSIYHGFVS